MEVGTEEVDQVDVAQVQQPLDVRKTSLACLSSASTPCQPQLPCDPTYPYLELPPSSSPSLQ